MTCTAAWGSPGLGQGVLHYLGQGQVGVKGLFASLEDHGVPTFQAKGGGIHRDIGTGLINKADHPQRNALSPHFQAVRPHPHAGDGPHRVRQGRHFLEPLDHGGEYLIGERQPVNEGRGVALGLGRFHIPAVGRLNLGLALLEKFRHPEDDPVFDFPGQRAQAPGRAFSFPGHMMNQFWDIHGSTPSNLLA